MPTGPQDTQLNLWGALDADRTAMIDGWAMRLGLTGKAVVTMGEAAGILRISERSVREGIKVGHIPFVRIGRRVLIPVPMLLAMILENASRTKPT